MFSLHCPRIGHKPRHVAGFSPFSPPHLEQVVFPRVAYRGGPGARNRAGPPIFQRVVEQAGELLDHRAAELLGIHDRHRAAVIAGHVVADADRDQLDRRALLDPVDHLPQMPLEIAAAIGRRGRIVDRRAVRNDHQDPPLLGPGDQPVVRPQQRLAVDILLEQPLAHHQAEIAAGVAIRLVGALVDDVAQVVEPARACAGARRRARPRGSARPSSRAW